MILDATLSYLHFTALLILVGALSGQSFVLRLPLQPPVVRLLGRIDFFYWLSIALLTLAGVARVLFGVKGTVYYLSSGLFWAKIALYALIVVVSFRPTLRYRAWRQALETPASFTPSERDVLSVRKLVMTELHVLALMVLLAVLMARGFG